MNVTTITRRAHGTKPGDEHVHFIGEPVEFDLQQPRSDWSSSSRLHIPRIRDDEDPSGTAAAYVVLTVILLAVCAAVWALAGWL